MLGTAIVFVNVSSNYGKVVPAPEACVQSEVQGGPHDHDPPKDPKAVIKFRNNGGSPMVLTRIVIEATEGGVRSVFPTFTAALGAARENDKFVICTEPQTLLRLGHEGRNIKRGGSMVLLTVRPKTHDDVKKQEWDTEFRRVLAERQITAHFHFKYFHVPLFGHLLHGSKACELGRV